MILIPAFESKREALESAIEILGLETVWASNKIPIKTYLNVISRTRYNLSRDLGVVDQTINKLHKKIYPYKKDTSKPCTYILNLCGLKYCPKCSKVLWLEDFYTSNNSTDGYCKSCFIIYVRPLRANTIARKRAELKSMTPAWADTKAISEIYKNCTPGNHIDHIIPLRGELVCGLHVESNLQEISAKDNILKSNHFDPDTFIGP
jgi:hypothetical protein